MLYAVIAANEAAVAAKIALARDDFENAAHGWVPFDEAQGLSLTFTVKCRGQESRDADVA